MLISRLSCRRSRLRSPRATGRPSSSRRSAVSSRTKSRPSFPRVVCLQVEGSWVSQTENSHTVSRQVTVVGGGIAGLVAAIEAATAGADVRLLEERAELGGRARTAPPPFRANLGPHALYSDGAFWRWLEERDL